MSKKSVIKHNLILGLFALCLGGWLLHFRIHPPEKNPAYFIPFCSGLLSIVIVPALFWFRRTLVWGYILNGFLAIIGAITMTHFSAVHFDGSFSLPRVFTDTLFADVVILWAKFSIGRALFVLETLKADTDSLPQGRYFRYPNMGWWWVHAAGLSVVYALGNILWK